MASPRRCVYDVATPHAIDAVKVWRWWVAAPRHAAVKTMLPRWAGFSPSTVTAGDQPWPPVMNPLLLCLATPCAPILSPSSCSTLSCILLIAHAVSPQHHRMPQHLKNHGYNDQVQTCSNFGSCNWEVEISFCSIIYMSTNKCLHPSNFVFSCVAGTKRWNNPVFYKKGQINVNLLSLPMS